MGPEELIKGALLFSVYSIILRAEHLPGSHVLADALSRNIPQVFHDLHPEAISQELWEVVVTQTPDWLL